MKFDAQTQQEANQRAGEIPPAGQANLARIAVERQLVYQAGALEAGDDRRERRGYESRNESRHRAPGGCRHPQTGRLLRHAAACRLDRRGWATSGESACTSASGAGGSKGRC